MMIYQLYSGLKKLYEQTRIKTKIRKEKNEDRQISKGYKNNKKKNSSQ